METLKTLLPLATFFLGVFFSRWKDEQDSNKSHISEILQEIKRVEDLAVEYWTRNRSAQKDPELEVRIRGCLFAIFASNDVTERCTGKQYGEFYASILDFSDAITNGDFETTRRKAAPDRAIQILKLSAQLRHVLYQASTSNFIAPSFIRTPFRKLRQLLVWFFNL